MKSFKRIIRRIPIVRDIFLFLLRCESVFSYLASSLSELLVWLFTSKEYTNFTYDLTSLNKQYLTSLIANITKKSFNEIYSYIVELENNDDLRSHIKTAINRSDEKYFADYDVRYGRRLGWYALVRAVKPKFVVETGADKGLEVACLLLR